MLAFTKRHLQCLLHKATSFYCLKSQGSIFYLDVDRLGYNVGQERGVAEVVGVVLVLAPLAPFTREVRLAERSASRKVGGGQGVISSRVKDKLQ